MSDYLDAVRKALQAQDEQRERSQQTAVGWSEVGGCRSALGYTLAGEWPSDQPDTWGAIRGTMLHEAILGARAAAHPHLLHEVPTEYRGIPGHADEVDPDADEVTDLKTSKLANVLVWRRDPEALLQKRMQVHGYAAGLVDAGVLTESCRVRILAAPVDGTFDDWWEHVEPFDRSLADQAVQRLDDVRATVADGRADELPRDMPYSWCESWCEWFTLCRLGGDAPADEPITDPELAAAVQLYGEANAREAEAKREKRAVADLIRGLRGTARGWRVAMTSPKGTKPVPDLERIAADYERVGGRVPTVDVPTSSPSLRVTRAKDADSTESEPPC